VTKYRHERLPAAGASPNSKKMLDRFRKELSLNDDQAKEIELVLDDFAMYYQTLQAQMDEVRANGKDRIVKVLSQEQREKFNRMMSDLQARQIR
jgi:DNA-binding MarR family transcriptional regulator